MTITKASQAVEKWLLATGKLSEEVGLQEFEYYLESDYDSLTTTLEVRRRRSPWGEDTRLPLFELSIPFDEDDMNAIIELALEGEK